MPACCSDVRNPQPTHASVAPSFNALRLMCALPLVFFISLCPVALFGAVVAMISMVYYNLQIAGIFVAILALGFMYYALTHANRRPLAGEIVLAKPESEI